jgi:hypothetical protein
MPKSWRGDRKNHNELDKNHMTSQNMGNSFYHISTIPYLFLLTLFFRGRGVGIHNVISKNYMMNGITLISRKIHVYDKCEYETKTILVYSRICDGLIVKMLDVRLLNDICKYNRETFG